MKKVFFLLIFLLITGEIFSQKSFQTYYQLSDFMQASPGAFRLGLNGYQNPSILNYNTFPFEMNLLVSEGTSKKLDFDRWGLFYSGGNFGFGAITNKFGDKGVTDYRLSWGFGSTKFGLGLAYGWSGGDADFFGRKSLYNIGLLLRPIPELSIAGNYMKSTVSNDAEVVAEIAVRPIGTYPLAVFADASLLNDQSIEDVNWSAGLSWEIVDGIRVNGRYFKNESMSLGIDLSFGRTGISSISQFNKGGEYAYNTYGIRLTGKDRTIFDEIIKPKFYARLNLTGSPSYVKYQLFDNSVTLFDILNTIDLAKNNPYIHGLVVNTAEFTANRAILWEIREKLLDFKSTGKKLIVFLERANMDIYALATVADEIIMEEIGSIELAGYSMGRSYYKKMFDNIGLGFQELRYFKYKSAVESYSRENFSEGDKEQRQRMIDEWYDITTSMISSARKISKNQLDEMINKMPFYSGKEALDNKLVDKLARITDLDSIAKSTDKTIQAIVPASFLFEEPLPIDDQWAYEKDEIAIIYAIGACDLNTGISARKLVGDLQRAYNNPRVKAIVLRVDSPGGDGLASDYIAKVVRDNKNKKPLIVSQGFVAASGGYWLSMDADVIVSTPVTITGSIGVISGYLYDKGLKDSIGITYDIVKRGKFSDLGSSYTFPIIPIGFPVRPMTDEEVQINKDYILKFYEEFVQKVANGRKMDVSKVKEVAQGRIWSGRDAKNLGLVDQLGGLYDAINIAREKAGIPKNKQIKYKEYPKGGLFDFSIFTPKLLGINIEKPKSEIEKLKFLFENNGKAMPIIPIDWLDIVEW